MSVPNQIVVVRARVGAPYLTPSGIEIGALYARTPLPAGASVRYVDLLPLAEYRRQHPELAHETLVDVDVVDDGQKLARIPDASLDLLIANHVLEHCENLLGTLRTHLRRTKPAGWLFYAVPDMRCNSDSARPITSFAHLIADHRDQGEGSRYGHYLECAQLVRGISDTNAAEDDARDNLARRSDIHFHVWDANAWFECIAQARRYLDNH